MPFPQKFGEEAGFEVEDIDGPKASSSGRQSSSQGFTVGSTGIKCNLKVNLTIFGLPPTRPPGKIHKTRLFGAFVSQSVCEFEVRSSKLRSDVLLNWGRVALG